MESRESSMVPVKLCVPNKLGETVRYVDKDLAPFIQALNDCGIETVASCSGHGHRPSDVILRDGRYLVIARNREEWKKIEALFSININGEKRDDI